MGEKLIHLGTRVYFGAGYPSGDFGASRIVERIVEAKATFNGMRLYPLIVR